MATAALLLAASAVASTITGCASGTGPAGTSASTGAPAPANRSFTDGGVSVTVTLERTAAARVLVIATLRPQRPGFHLYSLDLPDGGVDGLGIPTRLIPTAPLTPLGPVTTPARPYGLHPQGLDVTLPVYPDGPVTLHLPTRLTMSGATTARLLLTYGACSSTGGCLPPVRAHAVTLPVPPTR